MQTLHGCTFHVPPHLYKLQCFCSSQIKCCKELQWVLQLLAHMLVFSFLYKNMISALQFLACAIYLRVLACLFLFWSFCFILHSLTKWNGTFPLKCGVSSLQGRNILCPRQRISSCADRLSLRLILGVGLASLFLFPMCSLLMLSPRGDIIPPICGFSYSTNPVKYRKLAVLCDMTTTSVSPLNQIALQLI